MAWVIEDADKPKASKWDISDASAPAAQPESRIKKLARSATPWMRQTLDAAGKIAPYAQAALGGPGASGEGDFSPLANTVMNMAGAKPAEPLRNIPQNIPQMNMSSRFGPVMGAGVNLGRLAGEAIRPGYDAAEHIPDKSIAYGVAGMVTPGGEKEIAESALNAAIDKGIAKGIRPSSVGLNTYGSMKKYVERARDAVKTIFANKENLALTDEFGEATGKLPQTVEQLSQAVSKTKAGIFKQYDAMAKAAGEQGVKVDLEPLAKEFDKAAGDTINAKLHPEVSKYAADKAAALRELGSMTPEQAQNEIAHVNEVTKAFQQNPNPGSIKNTAAEALYGNMLRRGLDDAIEKAPAGPGYQELKNKYGALKTIEKDVVHRAIVEGRKNNKGLIDFADIGSAAELARGLVTMNPGALASSGAMKLITELYRKANSPNHAIKSMFSAFEGGSNAAGRALGMGATQLAANRVASDVQPSPAENKQIRGDLDQARAAAASDAEANMGDYDYSGYSRKYGKPDQSKGQHLTDEFKLPNHITFSTDSKYSTAEKHGGEWKEEGGKWHFYASPFNLKQHSESELKEYFKTHEKDSVLHLPTTSKADSSGNLTAAQRGIEFYTGTNWDDAIKEWRQALKEPGNHKQIVGWINKALAEKKGAAEIEKRKANKMRDAENEMRKYLRGGSA